MKKRAATIEKIRAAFPATATAAGHQVHVFKEDGVWAVWLNTEVADFDGLCIGVSTIKRAAVTDAIRSMKAAITALQAALEP